MSDSVALRICPITFADACTLVAAQPATVHLTAAQLLAVTAVVDATQKYPHLVAVLDAATREVETQHPYPKVGATVVTTTDADDRRTLTP